MQPIIDTHVHLDHYRSNEQQNIIKSLQKHAIYGLVSVSMDLASCKKNLALAQQHEAVFPAFGYHPEQSLPSEQELEQLFNFIHLYHQEMIAIGEVGLPYYTRQEQPHLETTPYVELLELFVLQAKNLAKPISLHAVYEDAAVACDLLEKHSIKRAHFHWLKGDQQTIERIIQNGYMISFTPDIVYEQEIQTIAHTVPLSQMLVETDGPWPFEGPFHRQLTTPSMMRATLNVIATLKKQPLEYVTTQIFNNSKLFFNLPSL